MDIVYRPIGLLRTPFKEQEGTPIQPAFAEGARGMVVIEESCAGALDDLAGFTHAWLLFHCDRAGPWRPRVVPYRDTRERGLFATRAPSRPNPIGLSVVRLVAVRGREIDVEGVDMLDRTPLLDIKPYVPAFDSIPSAGSGWLGAAGAGRDRADGRFSGGGGGE